MSENRQSCVALLVDNRNRDLLVATLIARHLATRGINCLLEPLEAYQGVLATHRPRMIIFNHLLASHLVAYSQRLHRMGVLVGVLPNEGIAYNQEDQKFLAGSFHSSAHIDLFFCWNEMHRQALREVGFGDSTEIKVTGVPRFDYYFPPWRNYFEPYPRTQPGRPLVLVCTNFVFAHYRHLAPEVVDKFFAPWKDRVPAYKNYWDLVALQGRSQERVLQFLSRLAAADCFDLVVRPHPSENIQPYADWFGRLDAPLKAAVRLDHHSPITQLILACDIELSCEVCTTALESWIARKPTIELQFEQHPVFAIQDSETRSVVVTNPDSIVETVRDQLANPEQPEYHAARQLHLKRWCSSPSGKSAATIAESIVEMLAHQTSPDWRQLTWTDYRRAWKLRMVNCLGHAYHFDPLLPLKSRLFPTKYGLKDFTYRKSILPGDIAAARRKLEACLTKP